MDNFTKIKNNIDPIKNECIINENRKMILYKPLVTGGNIPNNVKTNLYSQYIKNYIK